MKAAVPFWLLTFNSRHRRALEAVQGWLENPAMRRYQLELKDHHQP